MFLCFEFTTLSKLKRSTKACFICIVYTLFLRTSSSEMALRSAGPNAPQITRKALFACQINDWYPSFRKVSIKTKFVDLDPPFVEYLLSDGIIMPEGCDVGKVTDEDNQDSWSSSSDAGSDNEECDQNQLSSQPSRPQFNAIIASISQIISELGGAVFPKLNWSAPRDTTWINAGENLKCVSTSDVILLVKIFVLNYA
jgi:hypothetical protein